MTKDYLHDETGNVKNCTSNIAKMNVFEWMYYNKYLIFKALADVIDYITKGILGLIVLILFPVLLCTTYPYLAYKKIKEAKRDVELYQKTKSP